MFQDTLTQLGLTPEETAIYTYLLENGPQTATTLGKNTKVKRTYVYAVSRELLKKGLIRQETQGRTTHFIAQSPDKLLDLAESRRLAADQTRSSLENILPTLKSQYSLSESKPVVSYFEGVEGIKKVYLDTLQVAQPILALVETSKVHPDVYAWVTQHYAQSRVQAKIPVKAIVASGPKTKIYTQLDKKELRQTKLIDSSKFPFEHEVNIYGTKLAIINHKANTPLIGIIIDNPTINQTFRSWFDLTWESL